MPESAGVGETEYAQRPGGAQFAVTAGDGLVGHAERRADDRERRAAVES
nr:hypothetical protein [Nocardia sputi]